MLKKIVLTSLILVLGLYQNSFAEAYSHILLKSTSEIKISVDYQIHKLSYSYHGSLHKADPVWINVSGFGLTPSSRVRVVFISHCNDTLNCYGQYQENYEIDLEYKDGHFTGAVPYGIKGNATYRNEELAVVVNGTWLKDSVSRTSNFQFSLFRDKDKNKY